MSIPSLGLALWLSTVGAVVPSSPSAQDDDAERSWTQPRGNAAGTARVAVAAIRSDPIEAWRLELGAVLGEPVVWGDTLYVATTGQRRRTLFAISLTAGEVVAETPLGGKKDFTHLAVWQGQVVVVEPSEIKTYTHDGDDLKRGRRLRGKFAYPPCLVRDKLFVGGPDGSLTCVDIGRGKACGSVESVGVGRPAFRDGVLMFSSVQTMPGSEEMYLGMTAVEVSGLDQKEVVLEAQVPMPSALFQTRARSDPEGSYVIALYEPRVRFTSWYFRPPLPLMSADGNWFRGLVFGLDEGLSTITTQPAALGQGLYGFAEDGTFIVQGADASQRGIVAKADLPRGARPGPATVAGSVAYLGNWAVDLTTSRVLWCVPELDSAGPLIPVADGRLAYWTDTGDVVCLRDAGGATGPVDATASVVRPSRPGSGDAVVLADGRRVAGEVERLSDGRVRVVPAGGGEAMTFDAAWVVFVESDGEAELLGEEYSVYCAWLDALNADVVDALAARFEDYLGPRLLEDCERILAEARARGISDQRAEALGAMLVGKTGTTASNAERQRDRIQREEAAEREALVAEFLAASDWCRERGFAVTATVLLVQARELLPAAEGIAERAAALVPPGLPSVGEVAAPERWMRWAVQLAPAGARFVDPGDAAWKRVVGTIWEDDTIALATRNLLVFSKCDDPAIVGSCLRYGEGAVRSLERLLGRRAEGEPPFEVRLHADREAYLAERTPEGTFALPWSAGYYSMTQRVSRFYVPPPGESLEPLGRQLHTTFAHELTHQFLAEPGPSGQGVAAMRSDQPGYWVVEGFARFVEDQIVEMGRSGLRFDDDTVASLDATARLAADGHLVPVEDFVDLSQADFVGLEDTHVANVQLRNRLATVSLTRVTAFYEQAGSLVFFMLHRRGDEGRAALVAYLRDYYLGRSKADGWKALGFESAVELERAFREFLGGLL